MTGTPIKRARQLRREATMPERLLWSRLRAGQLSGLKFRRQHPVGPYIADAQIRRDASRTAFLEREGWQVIRFWNVDVMESLDGVLQQIEETARFILDQT